ncbi:MAG: hypothetical protein HRT41_02305 [Campylobacteraceae bacterium]|nr:hypothetical protein [Campylobacteraceae bacterium]
MTNLPVVIQWADDIYQIETKDNVIGGVDGIANKQALSLSNRTHWLKSEVEKRAKINGNATETFKVALAEVDDDAVNKLQMEQAISNTNSDFVVLTPEVIANSQSWDGVVYIDPDAIGANPVAKIYPDGTIVGSTDNGKYIKYPNGKMECQRLIPAPSSLTTIYLPATYIGEYVINGSSQDTIDRSLTADTVTPTTFRCRFINSAGQEVGTNKYTYITNGWWK